MTGGLGMTPGPPRMAHPRPSHHLAGMNASTRLALAPLLLTLTQSPSVLAQSAMHGIAKDVAGEERPYITAGDRAYLIGSQSGGFPDMGDHVAGEMGGLWIHPIKVADGFWATVRDLSSGDEVGLTEADELVTYPYANRLHYGPVLDGLEIERLEFSPDSQPGVI